MSRTSPAASLARTSCVALAAGHDLAPDLGGQGVRRPARAGSTPSALGPRRRTPAAISGGQRQRHDALAHRGVDVAVGVVRQQPPDATARRSKAILAASARARVEQEGDDRVLADVVGDVLLGVVGPHLLLVDVLLEDVAQHIGVDLVVGAQRALVEVPVVRVEEVEELLEGRVGDLDGLAVGRSSIWWRWNRPPFR